RPYHAANKDVLGDGIGPHVLPMAHRGVPHASPAFLARPGRGIRWTVVLRALHCGRINHGQYVDVRREVFERIPFLLESELASNFLEAGELRIGYRVSRDLLCAVLDELAAEKAHVGVRLATVVQVTGQALFLLVARVKRVAGRVRADKAFAAAHVLEQRLLAL